MDSIALLAKCKAKQRLTVLGAVSALLIGLNQYPDPPQAAPSTGKQQEVLAVESPEGMLPHGYNKSAVIRDPFAAPVQFRQPSTNTTSAGVIRDKASEKARDILPVVQGIVAAGPTKVAIMSTGSGSRTYRVSERVGAYVITAITSHSVALEGPEGTVVVPMGR